MAEPDTREKEFHERVSALLNEFSDVVAPRKCDHLTDRCDGDLLCHSCVEEEGGEMASDMYLAEWMVLTQFTDMDGNGATGWFSPPMLRTHRLGLLDQVTEQQ